jgi:hypothetical protein
MPDTATIDFQPEQSVIPSGVEGSRGATIDFEPDPASSPAISFEPHPTVTAKTTGYHPVSPDSPEYKMEGGPQDRAGNPIYTLDQYRRGDAPFVTVAGDPAIPYGTPAASPDFPGVPFRVNDTGSAFKGAGLSRFDIARDNAAGANSDENNRNVDFQIDPQAVDAVGAQEAARKSPGYIDLFDYHVAHSGISAAQGVLKALLPIQSDEQKRGVLEEAIAGLQHYKDNTLPRFYGVSEADTKTTAGKVTGALASVSDIAAGPALMIAKMAGQSYSDSYDAGLQKALADGVTNTEELRQKATSAARMGVATQAPVLAAYALGGKIAGAAAGRVLPATAGPILRGAVGTIASGAANLSVSGATRAVEGQPFAGDLQQNLTDAFFGVAGGAHEAFQPPRVGLSDVQVPNIPDTTSVNQLPTDQPPSAPEAPAQPPAPQPVIPSGVEGSRGPAESVAVTPEPEPAGYTGPVHMPTEQFAGVRDAHSFNNKFILDGPAGDYEISKLGQRKYYGTPELALKAAGRYQKQAILERARQNLAQPASEGGYAMPLKEAAKKLKLRANASEAGYLNADHLQAAADIGRRIYSAGMDFAQWSAEMLRQLGAKIRPHLEALWNSITGQNILPGQRERGSIGGGLSQEAIEGAANDPRKQREHIATIQRMTEVSPSVKERVESWYSPSSIPEVNTRAQARIDERGLDNTFRDLLQSKLTSNDDLALAHAAALRLDALSRYDDASAVRNKMAESLTGPAQMLQYISTISKTSPEGLIREAQKVVTEAVQASPQKTEIAAQIDRIIKALEAQMGGKTPDQQKVVINFLLHQLGKVNERGQRVSPDGIRKLLEQNDKGTLTPAALADALAKHLGIPKLTPENIAKIKAAQKLYAQAEASGDPIMRLRRGGEMMDAVYGLVPRSIWDKIRATATLSMIMHMKLPVRIGFSNALRMAGQTMVDTIENVPRDIGNVFMGRRTLTAAQFSGIAEGLKAPYSTWRSGFEDAKVRGLTTMPAFREGVRTLLDLASMTTRGIQDLTDIQGRSTHIFSSRFGKGAEDFVTLIHNIIPYAFWNAGYKSSLARQMTLARVDVPTADMIGQARLDANRAIFQNTTVAYHMLYGVRKILDADVNYLSRGKVKNLTTMQAKYGLGTATIPFAKVPAAILTEGATWSPLGFIRGAGEAVRPLFGSDFRPKEMADAMIKASIGTGSLFLTGMWLAKLGIISGSMDDDKDVRAMMQSLGWGAYKINLSELKRRLASGDWHTKSELPADGDTIVNYNWAEPVAFPLAMGAHLVETREGNARNELRGRITSGELATSARAGIESLVDNPMLQGVSQVATNVGEGNYSKLFSDLVGNVPGNFVPSLVRQTAQYMDNTVREVRAGGPVNSEIARLEVQLPWLSQKFPARYDVFGEAVQRQNYGRVSLINTFFNPAQISKFKANPEVAEMMRLTTATGSSAAVPKNVDSSLTITKANGQKQQVQLDNQQLATYQRYVGRLSAAMVVRLMASPAYAALPDQAKQNTLTEALSGVQRAAKIDLFGDRPFKISAGSLTSSPGVSLPNVWDIAGIAAGRQRQLNQPAQPGANY